MKVLVCDNVSREGVELLKKEFDVDERTKLTEEELIEIIPEYDALIVRSQTIVTQQVISAAVKLKAIGRAGVGVDNVDVQAATQKGIIVLNAPEGNTMAATEHTMAMMLAMARNLSQADKSLKAGKWEKNRFTGVELRGKTIGVLGLGRIGAGVAKRALAMEMNVLAYDPFISADIVQNLGIELVSLDTIYDEADFITLHLPLTPETKNLMNEETFSKIKKGVRIINCARGGVIDEHALAKAIEIGKVKGAAIDVFSKEPIQADNPLLKFEQVVLTPHLGAATLEAQVNVAIEAAKGITAALKGEPVAAAVNMAPLPAHVFRIIRPYLSLAERMGCLAIHLADGRIQNITIEYNGDLADVDTKLLTTAVLKGMLNPVLEQSVNYVNAPGLAKLRGIKVREIKSQEPANFANLITVIVNTDKETHHISGTLFGQEGRIVLIDEYRVDVAPVGWLLIGLHVDRPGMVGKVGTILGEYNINIASMQVCRTQLAGKNIMVMGIENKIPTSVMLIIKAIDGIMDAKLVNFNEI